MNMNMHHGLASSRADIHAEVEPGWLILCSQPRSHSKKHFNNRCQFAGRQLKEVRNVSPWDYERVAGRDGKGVCDRHRQLVSVQYPRRLRVAEWTFKAR